jgi:hypothetical protein
MRILIAGSRTYNDYNNFCDIMDFIIKEYTNGNIEIVSGGAKGADTLAEKYAKEKQLPITIFPAKWEEYGKSAGFIRNVEMHNYINEVSNRMCVCFWDGLSRGTQHNFKLCKKFDTPLICYNYTIHRKVDI